jgi:hypothetical protein
VARPNFSFQKRQKEQAREAKKKEKAARKLERGTGMADDADMRALFGLEAIEPEAPAPVEAAVETPPEAPTA